VSGTLKAIIENRLTVTDHDTGVIVGATAGYLRMVGSGENTSADGQVERLSLARGIVLERVEARLAAGSRSMTFAVHVSGSLHGAASASASVGTTWIEFSVPHAFLDSGERVAVAYTGLMAGDRLFTRVVWRG
jgi:hypothetical protein